MKRLLHAIPALIPVAVLGSWGVLLFHLRESGMLANMQNPAFQTGTLLCAGMLLALTLTYPFLFNIPEKLPSATILRWCGHSLLLALPWLAYALIPSAAQATGALLDRNWNAASLNAPMTMPKAGTADVETIRSWLKETAADSPIDATPLELIVLQNEPELRNDAQGRLFHCIGQYVPVDGKEFRLVRLLMVCCAADARPVGIMINGQAPAGIKDGDWLMVEGNVDLGNGSGPPRIKAVTVERTDTPEELFLY